MEKVYHVTLHRTLCWSQ